MDRHKGCDPKGAGSAATAFRLDAVLGVYSASQDEDCLHLDIWAPAGAQGAPVLVFVHGGAFMTGGGSTPCYDGASLAASTGQVVVNVSYRLGALGFLPIPGVAPPNLGLADQIAAFRWIRRSIKAFGGDPARVTAIGQSAGAFTVATLMATPLGRELFDRAVLMSAPLGIALKDAEAQRPIADAFLKALGLDKPDAAALRALPMEKILEAQRALLMRPPATGGDVTPPFMPVLDGDLLPCDPLASIEAGAGGVMASIVGWTREEFAAFAFGNPAVQGLGEEALLAIFRRLYGERAAGALDEARAIRSPASPAALLGDIRTDLDFADSVRRFAAARTAAGAACHLYRFDWQSPAAGLGACHCIDLPFLFGNFGVWGQSAMVKGALADELANLSRLFQGAIAAFASTGDPNGAGLARWPTHDARGVALRFDRRTEAFIAPV